MDLKKFLVIALVIPLIALSVTGCLGSNAGFSSSQHYSLNSIDAVPNGNNSSYVTYVVNFSITNAGETPLQTKSRYIDDALVLKTKDGSVFSAIAYWDGEWWNSEPKTLEPGESANYTGSFYVLESKVPASLWFQGVTFAKL